MRTAAVVTLGRPEAIGEGLARLERVAQEAGVELFYPKDEAEKHDRDDADFQKVDLVVVLGGDGTMLRALRRTLGTGMPVVGVNFGEVGFLTSITADGLEAGLARVFAGEYVVAELPTLDVQMNSERHAAVNDIVVASSIIGRMIQLGWAVGGEDLGEVPCDGVLCSTPSGSTGYNLSNGGPVLVWGLDAQAVTFIAPHSLHARPLVVPRSRDVEIVNRTADVAASVLVDGQPAGELAPGESVVVRLGDQSSLLAHLPEATFFRRYRETFAP
ncbi:MAG: NAD(+)/NADH kinase [Actinomycetota bacterium]